MGRPVSGAGRGRRAQGRRGRELAPVVLGTARAAGVRLRRAPGWFGAGLGAAMLNLAEKRILPRGGWFPGQFFVLLFWKGVGRRRRFSRDHRRPPRGTGGEARAGGGGSSGQAGVGSPAAARTQESTCYGRSPEKGMAGAALAPCWHPKLGCRCSIQGSLPAGELAPSLMHRPFSILPSFALGAKKDQMNQG